MSSSDPDSTSARRLPSLQLWLRIRTFWVMFAHLCKHLTHQEELISWGPQWAPIWFVSRRCHTCGFDPAASKPKGASARG